MAIGVYKTKAAALAEARKLNKLAAKEGLGKNRWTVKSETKHKIVLNTRKRR